MMKNEKSQYPGKVVESVSRFVGACVGTLVIGGKEIANEVREITKPKPGPKTELKSKTKQKLKPDVGTAPVQEHKPESKTKLSTRTVEESEVSPSQKKSGSAAKKKTASRQSKVKKK
jgi:hypothetical protein